ncbi:MAG: saccharopine dehydrogenase NADP-binding domain-containing protein [Planctomycetes bacterium]|nr:saccharopine dehydrogenase NADP-binding domain-containing protein [Planctomycetota bacterium]
MDLLRAEGLAPLMASRSRSADLVLDVENAGSLRENLRAGDVVIDAAGPFQHRNATLSEAALDVGFDVVDIADSLAYAMNFANQRVQSALACTDRLPESPARNSLRAMAEFIVQREY